MTATVRPLKARISNTSNGTTRVDVYDDIGAGGWFSEGLTAKGFSAQLADVKGPLEVHINSAGGDVFDGLAIKNAIESHAAPVTTIVDGLAASIASVIAMAGTERVMMPGSMLMIHDAFAVAGGNAAELTKMAQTLDEVSDNLAGVYARAAGGLPEQWRAAMKAETWYTAEQAVQAGLATRVGQDGGAVLPAGFDVAAYTAIPSGIAAQLQRLPRAKAKTERVLGIESMPILDKAMPIHHTATEDSAWDGPAAVAAMPADDAVLRYCHAWMSDEAAAEKPAEGDHDADDQKSSYKFPHHRTKGGPANLAACRNGLARLSGANIPDADRAGVKAHLQAHLDDANHGDHEDGPNDHAELPHWLSDDATPIPGWLNTPAEEANQ
jgi:ATP-dependent protease ClpP protease subunit